MITKIMCYILGHNFHHVRYGKAMKTWQLVQCKRCKHKFVLNHTDHTILPSDRELELVMDGKNG